MRFVLLCLTVLFTACQNPTASPPNQTCAVRVVLFGDSNTDAGWDGTELVEASYVSDLPQRLSPTAPHGSHQLAGKLEALSDTATIIFRAVNHGITGTGTGFGRLGGEHNPSARYAWEGVTRFEAEVLGMGGIMWEAGTSKPRVQSFHPTAHDYAYISLGTNDALERFGDSAQATIANLTWMADQWIKAGLPSSHFILTTLPPRRTEGSEIPAINRGIRQLVQSRKLTLLDLSAYTSSDDGTTWRNPSLHIGDGIHYTEPVREWIAEQIAATISLHHSP